MHEILCAGETIGLLPGGAIWWPRARTLIAADLHLGKAASFRASGIPVPAGTTQETLDRLGALLGRWNATRLIVLGDFFHARSGLGDELRQSLRTWRAEHQAVAMQVVAGNHDRGIHHEIEDLGMALHAAPMKEAPFVFVHAPEQIDGGYLLCGHLHPAVRLPGAGLRRQPCFLFTRDYAVLPAFGAFTGAHLIKPGPEDRIFASGPDTVIPLRSRGC